MGISYKFNIIKQGIYSIIGFGAVSLLGFLFNGSVDYPIAVGVGIGAFIGSGFTSQKK